eukprot:8519201-Alexandrium_andersonii.AAC.1
MTRARAGPSGRGPPMRLSGMPIGRSDKSLRPAGKRRARPLSGRSRRQAVGTPSHSRRGW